MYRVTSFRLSEKDKRLLMQLVKTTDAMSASEVLRSLITAAAQAHGIVPRPPDIKLMKNAA